MVRYKSFRVVCPSSAIYYVFDRKQGYSITFRLRQCRSSECRERSKFKIYKTFKNKGAILRRKC